MIGQEKIPLLLAEKSQEIVNKLVPYINGIATDVGIQDIGTPDVQIPDNCATYNKLSSILNIRNDLLEDLSRGAEVIKNISKITLTLGTVIDITDTTLNTLNATKTTITTTLQVTPSPTIPPPVVAGLTNLQTLINTLSPKLNKTKNTLNSINTALGITETILYTLVKMLKTIDEYLIKCDASQSQLIQYSDYLNDISTRLSQVENNTLPLTQEYQGFILEIVEEPYTPTVNRRKAVAKNKSNIVLLQTPLSFTTESQILIEDLKLIIDKNNLKAD